MRELFFNEYAPVLSNAAEAHKATSCDEETARWESHDRGLSVSLRLTTVADGADTLFVPKVSIGMSSCLPGNPLHALAILDSNRSTILAAVRAHHDVADVRVWMGRKPCFLCSNRGKIRGHDCKACSGTGWIEEVKG